MEENYDQQIRNILYTFPIDINYLFNTINKIPVVIDDDIFKDICLENSIDLVDLFSKQRLKKRIKHLPKNFFITLCKNNDVHIETILYLIEKFEVEVENNYITEEELNRIKSYSEHMFLIYNTVSDIAGTDIASEVMSYCFNLYNYCYTVSEEKIETVFEKLYNQPRKIHYVDVLSNPSEYRRDQIVSAIKVEINVANYVDWYSESIFLVKRHNIKKFNLNNYPEEFPEGIDPVYYGDLIIKPRFIPDSYSQYMLERLYNESYINLLSEINEISFSELCRYVLDNVDRIYIIYNFSELNGITSEEYYVSL